MLLRSMQKAVYSTTNIGHFGLALKNYTKTSGDAEKDCSAPSRGTLKRFIELIVFALGLER